MNRHHYMAGGALLGATLASVILNVLMLQALSLQPPGGRGEVQMWFGFFATLWGVPLSLLRDALIPHAGLWVKGMTVVLNGALWGAVVGGFLKVVSAKRSQKMTRARLT